jgi:glycogen operon protein
VTPSGKEATTQDWNNPVAQSLGYVLSGAAGEFLTPGGQRDIDESFFVMMNAYHEDIDFRIPLLAPPLSWEPLVDTSQSTGRVADGTLYASGEVYRLQAHSFALFVNRSPRPEALRRTAFGASEELMRFGPGGRAEPDGDDATPS